MDGKFQGFQGQNPPYVQGDLQWGKNQIPYGQSPPLWGHNPYQQGWVPPVGSAYRTQIPFNTELPFLATLELLDVSRLTNDLILPSPY